MSGRGWAQANFVAAAVVTGYTCRAKLVLYDTFMQVVCSSQLVDLRALYLMLRCLGQKPVGHWLNAELSPSLTRVRGSAMP